jgi:hypothetical protein
MLIELASLRTRAHRKGFETELTIGHLIPFVKTVRVLSSARLPSQKPKPKKQKARLQMLSGLVGRRALAVFFTRPQADLQIGAHH